MSLRPSPLDVLEDADIHNRLRGDAIRDLKASGENELASRERLKRNIKANRDILSVKAGEDLIPVWHVRHIEIDDIENEVAVIVTNRGDRYVAEGVDAIDAVMLFKPSALEGRRLRWHKNAWAVHNLIGHPVMQILAFFGFKRTAIRLHDATTPRPR